MACEGHDDLIEILLTFCYLTALGHIAAGGKSFYTYVGFNSLPTYDTYDQVDVMGSYIHKEVQLHNG